MKKVKVWWPAALAFVLAATLAFGARYSNEQIMRQLGLMPLPETLKHIPSQFKVAMELSGLTCYQVGAGQRIEPFTEDVLKQLDLMFGDRRAVEGPLTDDGVALIDIVYEGYFVRVAYTLVNPYLYLVSWCRYVQ